MFQYRTGVFFRAFPLTAPTPLLTSLLIHSHANVSKTKLKKKTHRLIPVRRFCFVDRMGVHRRYSGLAVSFGGIGLASGTIARWSPVPNNHTTNASNDYTRPHRMHLGAMPSVPERHRTTTVWLNMERCVRRKKMTKVQACVTQQWNAAASGRGGCGARL